MPITLEEKLLGMQERKNDIRKLREQQQEAIVQLENLLTIITDHEYKKESYLITDFPSENFSGFVKSREIPEEVMQSLLSKIEQNRSDEDNTDYFNYSFCLESLEKNKQLAKQIIEEISKKNLLKLKQLKKTINEYIIEGSEINEKLKNIYVEIYFKENALTKDVSSRSDKDIDEMFEKEIMSKTKERETLINKDFLSFTNCLPLIKKVVSAKNQLWTTTVTQKEEENYNDIVKEYDLQKAILVLSLRLQEVNKDHTEEDYNNHKSKDMMQIRVIVQEKIKRIEKIFNYWSEQIKYKVKKEIEEKIDIKFTNDSCMQIENERKELKTLATTLATLNVTINDLSQQLTDDRAVLNKKLAKTFQPFTFEPFSMWKINTLWDNYGKNKKNKTVEKEIKECEKAEIIECLKLKLKSWEELSEGELIKKQEEKIEKEKREFCNEKIINSYKLRNFEELNSQQEFFKKVKDIHKQVEKTINSSIPTEEELHQRSKDLQRRSDDSDDDDSYFRKNSLITIQELDREIKEKRELKLQKDKEKLAKEKEKLAKEIKDLEKREKDLEKREKEIKEEELEKQKEFKNASDSNWDQTGAKPKTKLSQKENKTIKRQTSSPAL